MKSSNLAWNLQILHAGISSCIFAAGRSSSIESRPIESRRSRQKYYGHLIFIADRWFRPFSVWLASLISCGFRFSSWSKRAINVVCKYCGFPRTCVTSANCKRCGFQLLDRAAVAIAELLVQVATVFAFFDASALFSRQAHRRTYQKPSFHEW